MAKRKGGSGFIYASLPLDMTQTLHELEEERPGTVTALILAYMDYAQDHAKEETVPEIVPEAPEGFSLAAKQTWRRLIQIYHGARGSYLAQVEGGKKAQPGPGRPKGSKNKPRESADTDTEAAEDAEEPEPTEPAADDIRITGAGPWLPSESEAKKVFWAAALSAGYGESGRSTVNAIASQVWARLNTHAGYLADHGMGGIDESEAIRLVQILMPEYLDPAEVPTRAKQVWSLLDAWARLAGPVPLDMDYMLDMFWDRDIFQFPNGSWRWRGSKDKSFFLPEDMLADIIQKEYTEAPEEAPGEEQENP